MKTFHYRYFDEDSVQIGESFVKANFSRNHAFFCAVCGEVWARITVDDPFATWVIANNPCRQHKPTGVYDWTTIPGSLLHYGVTPAQVSMPDWARALDYLPDAVVKREFEVHLANYDRQNGVKNEQSIFDTPPAYQLEPTPEYTGTGDN